MSDERGTDSVLDGIHGLVAELLTDELRAARSRTACEHCGNKPGLSPALLEKAIKFLKDNGIDQPARKGNRVDTLKQAMPDMNELEGTNITPFHRK